MDTWFWASASTTLWPMLVLLGAALCLHGGDAAGNWSWVDADIGHNIDEDELAFYVAMVTVGHI